MGEVGRTTLADLLDRASALDPSRPAVSDAGRTFDYAALTRVVEAAAGALERAGTGRGDRVALLGPRDARLLAAMYGVMRAGAAACVVAAEWSEADVRRRLEAIGARCVLATDPAAQAPGGFTRQHLDVDAAAAAAPAPARPDAAPAPTPDDAAYLSFTSGSSGVPKAVAVSHGNAAHYALGVRARLGFEAGAGVCAAHATTLAADLGHTAWLLALATAGRVHVVGDGAARDPQRFWAELQTAGVDCLKTTPSHLRALLDGRPPATPELGTLVLGGEVLSRAFAEDLLATRVARRVVNHYGPTETTVGASCFVADAVADLPPDEPTVPIGGPIGAAVLRLVDGDGAEAAAGQPGELLIGGPGVALGYHGAPEATAKRFVLRGGDRLYRTGDLCRRRADGDLVFLGRTDRQVKIRGYRVDPPEIEHLIDSCPGVAQSAVVVRETGGDRRLMAAVCLEGEAGPGAVDAIQARLGERLPAYSVPSPIVVLPAFPVGPNGKVDAERVAALVAEAVAERARHGSGPPRADPLTRALAGLWAEALGLDEVADDADLLAIGGDSILAMRSVAFLRRQGCMVTVDDVYRHGTATAITAAARRSAPVEPRAGAEAGTRSLGAPQRWLFASGLDEPDHWNQAVVLRCGVGVSPPALATALRAVLERHAALRQPLTPHGPLGSPRPVRELAPLSFSQLPADPGAVAAAVGGVCAELQRSLDLEAGRLLRAHLFCGDGESDDRLAIVIHHLAVDGVSWRILLADLAAAYRAAMTGRPAALPPTPDYYRRPAEREEATVSPSPPERPAAAPARALTWALDAVAAAPLIRRYGRGPQLEAVLLAAFADALAGATGAEAVRVEVEGHGRGEAEGEHLETVGWFTNVRWLDVPAARDGVEAAAPAVERALRDSPALPMDAAGDRPQFGFNFLGAFRLPPEPLLAWTPADEPAGPARCAAGDPLYRARLTVRILQDRLVADLVHRPDGLAAEAAGAAFEAFARAVAAVAGAEAPAVTAAASTSGLILHTGAPPARPAARVEREPAHVLLTGATGYLGRHLVEALAGAGARVTCLVRDQAADLGPAAVRGRVDAVAGDVTLPGLGLPGDSCRDVTAVVHAAADVRLVAPPSEIEATNVEGVRRLLEWIDARGPLPLHHVSTLAVAGYVEGEPRRFSEADFWIGQRFLSPYERSKFAAEELVRTWAESGRAAFIHRSGHIAADSRTGAFQRNAGENRIYQTLRGYVLAGAAPRRPAVTFAFSHADTVAAALAAVALASDAAPGVYHLETPHAVGHDELVGWLVDFGYDVDLVDDATFDAAVRRVEAEDATMAHVIASWARYAERNVRFDSSRTLAALARRGIRFAAPGPSWRAAALGWAVEAGVLPPPRERGEVAAAARG